VHRHAGRDRLGRDVFQRGAPEGLRLVRKSAWQASAFELFAAYGAVKARTAPPMHIVHARSVMTLEEATRLLATARSLVTLSEGDAGGDRYHQAIQASPDIAFMHAEIANLIDS